MLKSYLLQFVFSYELLRKFSLTREESAQSNYFNKGLHTSTIKHSRKLSKFKNITVIMKNTYSHYHHIHIKAVGFCYTGDVAGTLISSLSLNDITPIPLISNLLYASFADFAIVSYIRK